MSFWVSDGIIAVPNVRKALRRFVHKNLCKEGEVFPSPYDRSYYPTRQDISNHVHKLLAKGKFSNLIELWKKDHPTAKFMYRMFTVEEADVIKSIKLPHGYKISTSDECNVDDVEDESNNSSNRFLFIHMEQWQQKLLIKYGNTLSLIDATYKTTEYAMPLFLLCVRTNTGYATVSEFIVQDETAASISEALSIIKV